MSQHIFEKTIVHLLHINGYMVLLSSFSYSEYVVVFPFSFCGLGLQTFRLSGAVVGSSLIPRNAGKILLKKR